MHKVTALPRRKNTRRKRSYFGGARARVKRVYTRMRHRGRGRPKNKALLPLIGVTAPQLLINMGKAGGYDVVTPLTSGDYKGALYALSANEIKMWLGYDAGTSKWDFSSALLNYGSLIGSHYVHTKFGKKIKLFGHWVV